METLTCLVDDLLALENKNTSQFYRLLSDFHLEDNEETYFNEVFIPKIGCLYEAQILHKHFVYLSLIASRNFKVLELFVNYDKRVFALDINDPISLYKYCLYKEQHWINEVIAHLPEYKYLLPADVVKPLYLVSFVQKSNLSEIQIDELETLYLELRGDNLNEFWKAYLKEIAKLIDVTKYCKNVAKIEATDTELYYYTSNNSLLDTLSFYTDLSVKTQWDLVFDLLNNHSDSQQVDVFIGFIVLSSLADLLIDNNQELVKKNLVNILYDDLKSKILSIKNRLLQIELLEHIFSLLFHRNSSTFTCKERHLRFILYLLKTVIDELTLKKLFTMKTPEYQRLYKLQGFVSDGLWRFDLISDTTMPSKIENQLVNHMLASAESLIHLCLKRDNFLRANQVIENNQNVFYFNEMAKDLINSKIQEKREEKNIDTSTKEEYDYNNFKLEYEKEITKEKVTNKTANLTDIKEDESFSDAINTIIKFTKQTKNCTQEERVGLGWCCCCCCCRICRPHKVIDEAKKFFVENPVGVYHSKDNKIYRYQPSHYEIYAQKKLEKALFSL